MPQEERNIIANGKSRQPLRVAWFSYFPIERLPDLPAELAGLPRIHPATWQRVLWDQLKANERISLDIIVLRSHFQRDFILERNNTRFHCVKTPGGLRTGSFYWLDTFLIRKKLKALNPDLIHAWGTEFGAAAVAGRIRKLGYSTLVTMQGIMTWYGSVFPLNTHQKVARHFEPSSLSRARVATTESKFAMRYLGERYPNLKLLQAEHAPNPIFAGIRRNPEPNKIRILCLGTFLFWKGADVVIQALNDLTHSYNFELLWIGAQDRALLEELRGKTKVELWDRIQFKHDLAPAEIAKEFESATMLLHAARADNSPNSVKEAAVAGLPVVATDTGGIPDYIVPGKNGLLFQSGDVKDCRSKLEAAFEHPLFGRGKVDEETHSRMKEYLSAPRMAENFMNAYDVTLQTYGKPGLGAI
jgi:glycosyltransferase involved in cell wall biosynthesis